MDINKLKGHVPDTVIAQLPEVMTKFKIDTSLKLAHFLAQVGHESGGFKVVTENLNYSAQGLQNIFGKYFPGNLEESYARQPQKIANRVYASRMGNGDEASGDGYKFRGRGYIQLTGRNNYVEFSKAINENIERGALEAENEGLIAQKNGLIKQIDTLNNLLNQQNQQIQRLELQLYLLFSWRDTKLFERVRPKE